MENRRSAREPGNGSLPPWAWAGASRDAENKGIFSFPESSLFAGRYSWELLALSAVLDQILMSSLRFRAEECDSWGPSAFPQCPGENVSEVCKSLVFLPECSFPSRQRGACPRAVCGLQDMRLASPHGVGLCVTSAPEEVQDLVPVGRVRPVHGFSRARLLILINLFLNRVRFTGKLLR